MKKHFLLILILVVFNVNATTYYVNKTVSAGDITSVAGNNLFPGTITQPFATLAKAISVAVANDIIFVDADTYSAIADVNLALTATHNGVTITGSGIGKTIFDGGAGSGSFYFMTITGLNIHINNMTIQNYDNGGAIAITANAAAVDSARIYFDNVYFFQNKSYTFFATNNEGGAVWATSSSKPVVLYFTNCQLNQNLAEEGEGGGAIFVTGAGTIGASLNMNGCRANCNNTTGVDLTTYDGGAIIIKNCSANINNCYFAGNKAFDRSGGVLFAVNTLATFLPLVISNSIFEDNRGRDGTAILIRNNYNCTITNSVFYKNYTSSGFGNGGAISTDGALNMLIMNSTIADNISSSDVSGVSIRSGTPTSYNVQNSIIWGNQTGNSAAGITVANSIIQNVGDASTHGVNVLTSNPLFIGVNNYPLQVTSPAVNAGTPTGAPVTDIVGATRIGNPDMGAYELGSSSVSTNSICTFWIPCITPTITSVAPTTTLCSGGNFTTTLSSTTPTALTTYSWSSTSVAGITGHSTSGTGNINETLTNTSASTLIVTYSVTPIYNLICNGAIVVYSVSVFPTVSVSISPSSATICSGQSSTLTASGASSYTWTNATPATNSVVVVTPTTSITYSVIGANSLGCASINTATVNIIVNATPIVALVSVSNSTICSGNTTTITASGATTYTLTSATQTLTSNPFVVNPSATTTYTINGTNALGCLSANTVTTTITVNATPTVAILSVSNPTICSGNTTTITASGATTYTLTSATQTLTVNPFVVSPSTTATYTINGTSGLGCLSANTITTTVIVNATPTVALVSVSNPSICPGNTTTITASGATTYTLASSTQTLTSNPFVVSPSTTATYTINGTSAAGCLSVNTVTTIITVNATPTVALVSVSNPTICSGNTTTITASGANTYTLTSASQTLTANPFIVSPNTTTTYTIIGTSALGCLSANIITTTITVNTTPTVALASVSNPTICSGNTTTITASGATTYTLTSASQTLTSNPFTVSPNTTTTYTINGTSASGCLSANTVTTTITVNATPTISLPSNNISLCSGNQLVLPMASGGMSYNWSGPNSYTSSVSSPTVTNSISLTEAGTYTVSTTNTFGSLTCVSASQQVTVSVVSSAVISVPLNQQNLCLGSTATITPLGGNNYTLTPTGTSGLSFTVNPTANTTFTVNGSAGTGCAGLTVFTLTVNTLPTLTATTTNSTICSGNTNTISVSGSANSYTWSNNASSSTATTVIVSPNSTSTYTVIGTDAVTTCTNSAQVSVNVNITPTVSIAVSNNTICLGSTTTVSLSGANSYTITNPTITTTNTAVLTPTTLTTYTIVGSSQGCSSSSQTISIDVNLLPTLSLTNATVCAGSSATLIANGADTYSWTPINQTTGTVVVTPNTNTTYSVVGTNTLTSCSSTLTTVGVNVNALPTLTATSNPSTTCTSGSVTLNANSSATTPSYTWSVGNGITSVNQNQSSVSFPASSLTTGIYVYTVTVLDANSCLSLPATTTVNIITLPNANFNLSDLVLCQNENGNISINTPQTSVIYDWNINGQTITNTNPLIVPSSVTAVSGTYTVSVIASLGTCTNSASNTLTVNTLPTVSLVNTAVSACLNTTAQLDVLNPVVGNNYIWSYNGQTISSNNTLLISPLTAANVGIYTITVTDANGCVNTTTGAIELKVCEVFVPEFISPDGNGKNDALVIKNIENYPNNKLKIFNRWGNLIYAKDGYANEFEGYANEGNAVGKEKLPAGTYYVILNFGDGQTPTYNGILQLQY